MNIRAKLSVLMILVGALAVIPYSYFSLRRFSENSIENEKIHFQMLGDIVSEQLNFSYYTFLTSQVREISHQKEQLRNISRLVIWLWENLDFLTDETKNSLLKSQAAELKNRLGIMVNVFEPSGRSLTADSAAAPDWPALLDYTGQPLTARLNPAKLPVDGNFSVYSSKDQGLGNDNAFMGLVMPDSQRRLAFVNLVSVTEMKKQVAAASASIVNNMKTRLSEVNLHYRDSGLIQDSISLVDASGRFLFSSGPPFRPRQDMLENARREGEWEQLTDQALVRVEHFKPLDWFLVLAAPKDSIVAPARALASEILALGAGLTAISLAIALAAVHFFTRPLLRVSWKAAAAAKLDFTDPEAEIFFQDSALSRRRDEIGQLDASFVKMGRTIIQNVKQLVTAAKTQERLNGELSAARDIQLGILPAPEEAPREKNYQAAALLQPAKEIGGDLYDFFIAPDGRRTLVIGDVSDKGVPAALFMAMVCTLVRWAIASGLSPDEALRQINGQLNERNPNSMFVTLFIGLFDPDNGSLTYANGGHCQPLVVDGFGAVRLLGDDSPDPLVGIWPGLKYRLRRAALAPSETCLLYTDGVTEAQNETAEFFGEDRLKALLAAPAESPPVPERLIRRIYEDVLLYRGQAPQSDDITLLAFSAGRDTLQRE